MFILNMFNIFMFQLLHLIPPRLSLVSFKIAAPYQQYETQCRSYLLFIVIFVLKYMWFKYIVTFIIVTSFNIINDVISMTIISY